MSPVTPDPSVTAGQDPRELAELESLAVEALGAMTGALPGGGEPRASQLAFTRAVSRAIMTNRHLVVQAGTGTGKSFGYLVPALLSGKRVVVATATKTLQDQLGGKDLPFLAREMASRGHPFSFAVLKGRSNYLCRAKLEHNEPASSRTRRSQSMATRPQPTATREAELQLSYAKPDAPSASTYAPVAGNDDVSSRAPADPVGAIVAWAASTRTGDVAELPFEPSSSLWKSLSMTSEECPGRSECPLSGQCFAETARDRAGAADVVVVNLHLYGSHCATGGQLLPEHQVLVVDEAHQLEDVMSEVLGTRLVPAALRAATRLLRSQPGDGRGSVVERIDKAAVRLAAALAPLRGKRITAHESQEIRPALLQADAALSDAIRLLGLEDGDTLATDRQRSGLQRQLLHARAVKLTAGLLGDIRTLIDPPPGSVSWVEDGDISGDAMSIGLRLTPVMVGELLATLLWPDITAICTSATIPPLFTEQVGLPASSCDVLDVGSAFLYDEQALCYCSTRVPAPGRGTDATRRTSALHEEMASLIDAAGGRTLALFTSRSAMTSAAMALRQELAVPIAVQDEQPKAALLAAFTGDEHSCLFATLSFWQGVDIPGRSLSLVVMDKIPFPRPDDPVQEARCEMVRERGQDPFRTVSCPRAAIMLAQGAGRLIRSTTDEGMVAILDPRLVTTSYGRWLRSFLPPMPFTTDREEAVRFLARMVARYDST